MTQVKRDKLAAALSAAGIIPMKGEGGVCVSVCVSVCVCM